MAFNTGAALMDALVLSIVSQKAPTVIKSPRMRSVMDVRRADIVLRCCAVCKATSAWRHIRPRICGRNRRYYSITERETSGWPHPAASGKYMRRRSIMCYSEDRQ